MRNRVTISMRQVGRAAVCLAMLALALSAGRALAGAPGAEKGQVVAGSASEGQAPLRSASVPLGWSVRTLFKSNLTRTRAIQGAALFMAFGLFILMKKCAEVGGRGRRRE
jgi:hypothetical protein